jgi:hypothetical protein
MGVAWDSLAGTGYRAHPLPGKGSVPLPDPGLCGMRLTSQVMDHRAHASRGVSRRLGLIALPVMVGLAVLAAGCGSSGIPVHPPTASAPPVNTPRENAGTTIASGVSGGVLFGGNPPLALDEARLGRTLAVVRVYYRIGESFAGSGQSFPAGLSMRELLGQGSTLLVSLDSAQNGPSYASIIAGQEDATILRFLETVNDAAAAHGLPAIYICFEHEPDNARHAKLGSPAQFVQAWDHVHQLAASAHLDWNDGGRLHWVWIMVHSSFAAGGGASRWWPGASEVDVVAADGYNSYACRVAQDAPNAAKGQQTPASLFNPALNFALSHGGLPVFISEWGSDSNPAGTQSRFIHQMLAYVNANPEIAAVLYWDSPGVACNYSINGQAASLSAMTALAHSRRMQGRLARLPPSRGTVPDVTGKRVTS